MDDPPRPAATPQPGARYDTGQVAVTLLAHEPAGFAAVASEIVEDYNLEQLNLQAGQLLSPTELEGLNQEIALLKRGATGQLGVWNEQRPLPCWFSHDRGILTLGMSRRDYLTRRAANTYWEQARPHIRTSVLDHLARGGLTPLFAGTLGVHVTVETADSTFVLAQRSSRARSHERHYCLPIMEGAHDGDRVDGHLDATRTAVRGANEELGLAITGDNLTFHSLWVEHHTYGVVLQGHLDLRAQQLAFRDVKTSWTTARDAWENDRLEAHPAARETLDHLVTTTRPWLPWAQFAVALHRTWRWPAGSKQAASPLARYRVEGT